MRKVSIYLYYNHKSVNTHALFLTTQKLTKIQRVRKQRRKTARTPAEPERIVNRLLLHILILLQLRRAHRFRESGHPAKRVGAVRQMGMFRQKPWEVSVGVVELYVWSTSVLVVLVGEQSKQRRAEIIGAGGSRGLTVSDQLERTNGRHWKF